MIVTTPSELQPYTPVGTRVEDIVACPPELRSKLYSGCIYRVLGIELGEETKYQIYNPYSCFPSSRSQAELIFLDKRISKYYSFSSAYSQMLKQTINVFSVPPLRVPDSFNLAALEDSWHILFDPWFNKMSLEYASPLVRLKARIIDRDWVQCEYCENFWQVIPINEVIVCEKCKSHLLNPLVCAGGIQW